MENPGSKRTQELGRFSKIKKQTKTHFLFTTHATKPFWEADFHEGDGLLFGNEGTGAPKKIHDWAQSNRVTIPNYSNGLRSLNLAVSVGIATYEALRQIKS